MWSRETHRRVLSSGRRRGVGALGRGLVVAERRGRVGGGRGRSVGGRRRVRGRGRAEEDLLEAGRLTSVALGDCL
jgi:hypothetical protein